jgi:hypothetical protein
VLGCGAKAVLSTHAKAPGIRTKHMEMQTMLNTSENQDLSYVALQISEILFLADQAKVYGSEFVVEQIRESAEKALDRFQRTEGIINFELVK